MVSRLTMVPKHMPRMTEAPHSLGALAYYPPGTPGLEKMEFRARSDTVSLLTYDQSKGLVGVPRTLAPKVTAKDNRAIGEFWFDDQFTATLRPEQEPFVAGVFDMLENDLGGIGEAPTGFGKTVTGCALICKIGRPTCIIIPKSDLDWTGAILKHTTIKPEHIDVWQGQRLPRPDAKVVVAMLQSVYRDGIYPESVYARFACVIFDEVHRLGAPEFSNAIRKFPAMFRLGLSATADRRDGMMDLIHSHVGWRHVVGKSDAAPPNYYLIESGWNPPFFDGKRHDFDPGKAGVGKRGLIHDTIRNSQIAAAALRAHKAGRRTILFVEQIKHGDRIEAALRAAKVPSQSIIRYDGGVTPADKAKAAECPAGVVLIATYKFAAEGTNFPALDTCILAHPLYDAIQPVGRVTRKPEGFDKPTPVVIDIRDFNSPVLTRIHAARWEGLRKAGAVWKGQFA